MGKQLKRLRNFFLIVGIWFLGMALGFAQGSEKTFAGFAYFVDKLQLPAKKIGQVWATPRSVYEGPFHTNDQIHIYLPPNYFQEWHNPFFRGPVTTASNDIVYYDNYGPTDSAGNIDQKRWASIFGSTVTTGVPRIPLPEHPQVLVEEGALNGAALAKSWRGILIPHDANNRLNGGIFIGSSVDNLTFDAGTDGNLKITIHQRSDETTIDVLYLDNKTVLHLPDGNVVTYGGIPNGAIYINGNLGNPEKAGGIQGKIRGQWTVATEGDLAISNSLLYADTAAGSEPAGKDTLALVARNVFITREAPDMLFLYATIFAAKKEGKDMLGTLFVLPNNDFPHQGNLIWWGSYIGEYPAIMGSFLRSTGESRDGYDLHKYYDARLVTNPPPFFPTFSEAAAQAH